MSAQEGLCVRRKIGGFQESEPHMKHSMRAIVILVLTVSFAGCSKPCFYQAGTSMQQCKRDLLQCIDQAKMHEKSQAAQQVRSCMQAKGYECLDADRIASGTKRVTVMASFETYSALDGLDAAPASPTVTAQQQPQPQPQNQPEPQVQAQPQPEVQNVPDAPQAKPIGYRARLDENGKHTLIPVYENQQTQQPSSTR